jgi:hypothetical protein
MQLLTVDWYYLMQLDGAVLPRFLFKNQPDVETHS